MPLTKIDYFSWLKSMNQMTKGKTFQMFETYLKNNFIELKTNAITGIVLQ